MNNTDGKLLVTTKCAIICIDLEKQETYMIAGNSHKFGFKDGNLLSQALFDHPDGIVSV
jgi:hypothetical protein